MAEKNHNETSTSTITELDRASDIRAWPSGIGETTKRGHTIRLAVGTQMPAAMQESIARLLGELGFAEMRAQALATNGEMNLVFISGTETSHCCPYDSIEGRIFRRSRILNVSEATRLLDNYAEGANSSSMRRASPSRLSSSRLKKRSRLYSLNFFTPRHGLLNCGRSPQLSARLNMMERTPITRLA